MLASFSSAFVLPLDDSRFMRPLVTKIIKISTFFLPSNSFYISFLIFFSKTVHLLYITFG